MNVLMPIADGSEEMEAVICIDVFRRAGWDVTVAAVGAKQTLTASRGVKLVADVVWSDIQADKYDLIVLPGGNGGTERLCASEPLLKTLQTFAATGKMIGAICAAAKVLHTAGVLDHRRYTCYPGVEKQIDTGEHTSDIVCRDGNLITSQGPGTAFDFALAIVATKDTASTADRLREEMVLSPLLR